MFHGQDANPLSLRKKEIKRERRKEKEEGEGEVEKVILVVHKPHQESFLPRSQWFSLSASVCSIYSHSPSGSRSESCAEPNAGTEAAQVCVCVCVCACICVYSVCVS